MRSTALNFGTFLDSLFLGIAPTGREVTWTETHVGRFENDKLVEHWGDSDDLGLMRQLGAVPKMGEQGVEPSH